MRDPQSLPQENKDVFKHIDAATLLRHAGGDPALVRELLGIFVRTFATDIERLNAAVQADDVLQIRHLLHRVKGSLQILGAKATIDRIELVSDSLGNQIGVDQARALQHLFQCFDEILQEAILQA